MSSTGLLAMDALNDVYYRYMYLISFCTIGWSLLVNKQDMHTDRPALSVHSDRKDLWVFKPAKDCKLLRRDPRVFIIVHVHQHVNNSSNRACTSARWSKLTSKPAVITEHAEHVVSTSNNVDLVWSWRFKCGPFVRTNWTHYMAAF